MHTTCSALKSTYPECLGTLVSNSFIKQELGLPISLCLFSILKMGRAKKNTFWQILLFSKKATRKCVGSKWSQKCGLAAHCETICLPSSDKLWSRQSIGPAKWSIWESEARIWGIVRSRVFVFVLCDEACIWCWPLSPSGWLPANHLSRVPR